MFHPNRRYGNVEVLRRMTAGLPVAVVAKMLRRHPRTIREWLDGKRKMPWWVAEFLVLKHENAMHDLRFMGVDPRAAIQAFGSGERRPGLISSSDQVSAGAELNLRGSGGGSAPGKLPAGYKRAIM